MPKRAVLTEDDANAIVHRYQAGESIKALAKEYCVTDLRLKNLLVRRGVRIRTLSEAHLLGWNGRRKPPVTRTCSNCQRQMEVEQWKALSGRGIYCSNECRAAGRRSSIERPCEVCGKVIAVERNKDARGIGRYCSNECRASAVRGTSYILSPSDITEAVARYRRGESGDSIGEFFGVCPTTVIKALRNAGVKIRTGQTGPRPNRRKALPLGELVQLYADGYSLNSLAKRYNVSYHTVSHRLQEIGVQLRGGIADGNGHYIRCKDGHVVRSHPERVVDDWLYEHGIAHAYEPLLPFGLGATGDFYARGYYIEIWGLKSERYRKRRAEKTTGYESAGLRLISLETEDIDNGLDLSTALVELLP